MEDDYLPAISIRNGHLNYNQHVIFDDLNLEVATSQWVALLGVSGTGKSSLLHFIAGIIETKNISGTIQCGNSMPITQQISYMAQTDLLLPWLTVLDNTMIGYKLRGTIKPDLKKITEKAVFLLTESGLAEVIHLYPSELSGGMRQRVALVRTLMEERPIVLMDEPFSALDTVTSYKLQLLAIRLLQGKTVIFVTHNPTEALRLAHQIYVMSGQPAKIKKIIELETPAPREMNTPEMINLQIKLLQELERGIK